MIGQWQQELKPVAVNFEALDHHLCKTGLQLLNGDYLIHESPTGDEAINDSCSKTASAAVLVHIEMAN